MKDTHLFWKDTHLFCHTMLWLLLSCFCGCKTDENPPVQIVWEHISNDVKPNICESRITLTNISADTLRDDWAIYWNQMSVEPIEIDGDPLRVKQIQASYHTLLPTEEWSPLAPDSSITVSLYYKGNIMRRSGAPQGAFIVQEGQKPQTIKIEYRHSPDASEFRRKTDGEPYADGEEIYRRNERFYRIAPQDKDSMLCLLPQPKEIVRKAGRCLTKKALFISETDTTLPHDGYRLLIERDTIYAYVENAQALQYAKETVKRLSEHFGGSVPCCEISDWPDTQYRGLMIDIARNFTGKEELLKIIDLLAMYKMNVLHLHLTDDEGWRIEIAGLPELTEVGSRRGYTTDERDCLYPMYTGGWDPDDKSAPGNGYLTRKDFIEILHYAKEHYVRVVPEIDMPGHSRAAIKAMESRYWKYIATDKEKAEEYLLNDFADTSKYVSAQHYTDNVICIALPSCYNFCQKVIDEVVSMYREADAPIEIFHVGGDEVPRGAWLGSPQVAEYVRSMRHDVEGVDTKERAEKTEIVQTVVTGADVANLKDSFLESIAAMLADHGLQTAGWEEVAYRRGKPNPRFAGKNILTYTWNSVPEWNGDEKPYQLANAGYPVMICSVCNLYMDMCYLNHEEGTGLNWGGYVDEYCTFDLRPDSLYLSVRRTMNGKTRNLREYASSNKTQLIPDSAKNLKGVQAQLWSETIRSSEQLEGYLLPKLLGTAERTWNNRWRGEYETALNEYNHQIFGCELPYLNKLGYAFRLSPPGIRRENTDIETHAQTIYMNSAIEGAEIRYTLDGTRPTEQSALYTGPFTSDAELIKARCFYLGRRSFVTKSKK